LFFAFGIPFDIGHSTFGVRYSLSHFPLLKPISKKYRVWSTPGTSVLRVSPTGQEEKIARSQCKKLVFRYRQKIFTTNNHYEWSK
jgi:hypothetical protein